MALRKISAKTVWALAVFAIILSTTATAQGSEGNDATIQWTCSVAPKLDLGTNYYGYLESSTDVRWYKWNLPSSGKFVAEFEVPAGLDYDLEVYSSCSSKVCTSDKSAGEKEKCEVDAKAGWVYAKIYGYKGAFSKIKKYYIKGTFTASTKYDLAPAYILTIPSDPTDKDAINLIYPFVNAGKDTIPGKVTVKYFIDDNSDTCTKENIIPLKSFTCEKNDVKLSSGWHELKTIVDPDNQITETDESNNEHQQDLLVSHITDYDLTITDIWTSPGGELNDKMTFSLNWYVKNIGNDDIKNEFESEVMIDDMLKHTCIIKELKADSSYNCFLEGQKWKAGKHNVVAFADSDADIDETDDNKDSNNNKLVKNFDVTHVPETDLVVTNIYTDPASPTEKDTFSVKFDVKNSGSEAVPSGFKSNAFINGESKGTWCYTINLGAGASETCLFAKQKWQPGSYKVKIFADAENVINELSETNNELEKTIEVKQYCPIPDGSAADCECNKNTDCPSGYYCSLKEGYDQCKPLACKDECSQAGSYLCSQGDSYECGNFDSDPCLDSKRKQVCNVYSQKCNPAKGSCDEATSPIVLQLEDAPIHETTVYKQPGDLVEVTITSDKLQDVEFSHPENFTLTYGICGSKTAAAPGETRCVFHISETTATGEYQFVANEKTAAVAVIDKPKAVIITNKQKLQERFPNDKAGVKALLKQAFQYASNEENTVVYYLDREVSEHPFESYSGYGEDILNPQMSDNTYALSTAAFITEKCGMCLNTIILGDDYVVPHYRRSVSQWKGLNLPIFGWLFKNREISHIYTDNPYFAKSDPDFDDLDKVFSTGGVYMIVPDSLSEEEISLIKFALVTTYSERQLPFEHPCSNLVEEGTQVPDYMQNCCGCVVGNPNLKEQSQIKVYKSSEVACNSFRKLDKNNLILIGNAKTNNAIACLPWVDETGFPTISIQRNVWDGTKSSIVLNTDEENYELTITVFSNIIMRREWREFLEGGSKLTLMDVGITVASFVPYIDTAIDIAQFKQDCKKIYDYGDNILDFQSFSLGNLGWCSFDSIAILLPLSTKWVKTSQDALADLSKLSKKTGDQRYGALAARHGATLDQYGRVAARLNVYDNFIDGIKLNIDPLDSVLKKNPKAAVHVFAGQMEQLKDPVLKGIDIKPYGDSGINFLHGLGKKVEIESKYEKTFGKIKFYSVQKNVMQTEKDMIEAGTTFTEKADEFENAIKNAEKGLELEPGAVDTFSIGNGFSSFGYVEGTRNLHINLIAFSDNFEDVKKYTIYHEATHAKLRKTESFFEDKITNPFFKDMTGLEGVEKKHVYISEFIELHTDEQAFESLKKNLYDNTADIFKKQRISNFKAVYKTKTGDYIQTHDWNKIAYQKAVAKKYGLTQIETEIDKDIDKILKFPENKKNKIKDETSQLAKFFSDNSGRTDYDTLINEVAIKVKDFGEVLK